MRSRPAPHRTTSWPGSSPTTRPRPLRLTSTSVRVAARTCVRGRRRCRRLASPNSTPTFSPVGFRTNGWRWTTRTFLMKAAARCPAATCRAGGGSRRSSSSSRSVAFELNGDWTINGNLTGYGTIVVNGNLVVNGNFTYYGTIIVNGTLQAGTGNVTVYGGLVAQDTLRLIGNITVNGGTTVG